MPPQGDSLPSPDQEPGIAAGFGASLLLSGAASKELDTTKGEEKQQPEDHQSGTALVNKIITHALTIQTKLL